MIGRAEPQPNCDSPLVLEHEGSGRKRNQRCRATDHSRCKPCARTYRTRVFWVAESGRMMFPGNSVLMVTITAPSEIGVHCRRHKNCDGRSDDDCVLCECTPEGGIHIGEWNGTCSSHWNRLVEALRRETGVNFQYFKAAETQDRGALHFHVLIRLPKSRGITITKKQLRRLAIHYGFGHSVDVKAVSNETAASYLAKYVSKSCHDRQEMPWVDRRTGEVTNGNGRYRCWTSSRRWGWTMKQIREQQAAWVISRLQAQPPQAAQPGALDSRGHCYEQQHLLPDDGGRL